MPNTECVNQIVCGIQFSNSFKSFDKWGEIADEVLYSPFAKKLFGEKYYSRISNDVGYQRSLFNDETQNSLRLTQNNLIITHNLLGESFESQYDFVKDIIQKYVFPQVIYKHVLVVQRIGIVFTCSINDNEINKYKKTIIQPSYGDSISDFRFSRKETTPIGLTRQDTNNYINKIVTVGNLAGDTHGISYDYQYFYLPPNAQAGKDIDKLFCNALDALKKDIFLRIEDIE
jgi:hypothetical protein